LHIGTEAVTLAESEDYSPADIPKARRRHRRLAQQRTSSMSSVAHCPPEQGQLVSVRSRQWIVNDVRPSTLPAVALTPTFSGPQHLLTPASVEDDGLGEELQVIWEIEPGARVIEKVALPEPAGFDPPSKLDAFLEALRWAIMEGSHCEQNALRGPRRVVTVPGHGEVA
jgi:hypothetical protein